MSIDNLSVIKKGLETWLPEPTRVQFRISVEEPLIIRYHMTLGSLYYDSKKKNIITNFPTDPQVRSQPLVIEFLSKSYPQVLGRWRVVKEGTEKHLSYVTTLIKYLLLEVDDIISSLKARYPSLVSYDDAVQENFYVRHNILEGLYKQIEHIALTGSEIGLFQFEPSMGKVGNGFLFIKSSNKELLEQFMLLINKALHNERLISDFRKAEVKKAEVESKVIDFKQDLQDIIRRLP
jgi:hypothetical protein